MSTPPDSAENPKLRWHPFSLPLVLIFASLVCLFAFLWISELRSHLAYRNAAAPIQEMGGWVDGAPELSGVGMSNVLMTDDDFTKALAYLKTLPNLNSLHLDNTLTTDARLEQLKDFPQLKKLVLDNNHISGAGLEHLKGLVHLEWLSLSVTDVTDDGLKSLQGMNELTRLKLSLTQVGDLGLKNIGGLTRLTRLDLVSTQVTDAGLEHLKGLPELKTLDLTGTDVTDAGLAHLKGIKLEWLGLYKTRTTQEGIRKLKQALPECKIIR